MFNEVALSHTSSARCPRRLSVWERSYRREQRRQRIAFSDSDGSSLLELALLTSLFVLLLVGSVDLGQACYVAIELAAAANAGAQYGTRNPTDTSGMQKAALLNAANLPGATSAAGYGCECSDGTSASASCTAAPSCSVNVVRYVTVSTAITFKPALSFPGVPSSLALQGNARLRAAY